MAPSAHRCPAQRLLHPECCCPHRSGLKCGCCPGWTEGPSPGPPAVRAGTLCRGGAHFPGPSGDVGAPVPSRAKSRASQHGVPPALQCLTHHSLGLQTPRTPSKSSTTRGREHRPTKFPPLWLHQKKKEKEKRTGLLRYPQFTLAWKRTAPNSKAQEKVSWGRVMMEALGRPAAATSPGEASGACGVRKAERPHAYVSRNCTWKSLTFCRTIFSFSMGGRIVILKW